VSDVTVESEVCQQFVADRAESAVLQGLRVTTGVHMLDSHVASNHSMKFLCSMVGIISAMLALAAIAALVACGDPKYQASPIVVTFSTGFPPPTALEISATTGIAAVVTNDPKNAGVNFSCLPVRECGTFSPNPVASNVPTTYQAPPAVPSGGSATVTAASVTDPTKFVSATIAIDEP